MKQHIEAMRHEAVMRRRNANRERARGNEYRANLLWERAVRLDDAADELQKAARVIGHLQAERASKQVQVDQLVRILSGVHALCAPPDITLPDGSVRRFVPPDPAFYWRNLSDRIHAIEDQVRALFADAVDQAIRQPHPDDGRKEFPAGEFPIG